MQYRTVTCVSHDSNSICTADEKLKPIDRRPCNATCGQWLVSHWSENVSFFRNRDYLSFFFLKCTGSCNNATLTRRVWCSSSVCNQHERPSSTRRCILPHCTNRSIDQKSNTTSTRPTTTSSLKSTKTQLNTTIFRTSTTTTVTTSHKKTLTTTKTTTTVHKKISITKPSTISARIQKITTTTTKASTKKVLPTQKVTTATTKKNIITTTVRQNKLTMKSPRHTG